MDRAIHREHPPHVFVEGVDVRWEDCVRDPEGATDRPRLGIERGAAVAGRYFRRPIESRAVSQKSYDLLEEVIGADGLLAGCPNGEYFDDITPNDEQCPIAASFANLEEQVSKLFGEESTLVGDSTGEREGL